MTSEEVENLKVGDVLYVVDIGCSEEEMRIKRYRVHKNHKKVVIVERWPVLHPERTSQTKIDKRGMHIFEVSPEAALESWIQELRNDVSDARRTLEMSEEILAESLAFKTTMPPVS